MPYSGGTQGYSETWQCPHGFVSAEHRGWGQNYEQSWIEDAWGTGFTSAYERMIEEASAVGAHGVVGVVDATEPLAGQGVLEFRVQGTAVQVSGGGLPGGWTTVDHLPGRAATGQADRGRLRTGVDRRLGGIGPGLGLLHHRLPHRRDQPGLGRPGSRHRDRADRQGPHGGPPDRTRAGAVPARWRLAPRRIDVTTERELGEGDAELQCILRGNRVRRFKQFDPIARPTADGAAAVTGLRALGDSDGHPLDIKKEMLEAAAALGRHGPGGTGSDRGVAPMTSDLSIDEELALHSIGWEPIELVCGVSVYSVPVGVWNWGQGEITYASNAYARSFAAAIDRIHRECAKAGGHGVVGVHVEAEVHRHHVTSPCWDGGPTGRLEEVFVRVRSSSPTCPVATSPS